MLSHVYKKYKIVLLGIKNNLMLCVVINNTYYSSCYAVG